MSHPDGALRATDERHIYLIDSLKLVRSQLLVGLVSRPLVRDRDRSRLPAPDHGQCLPGREGGVGSFSFIK